MSKSSSGSKLYIICGHVGAGKTTTATMLGKMVNARVTSVDSTLKQLLPKPSFAGKDKPPTTQELAICYNAFAWLADYALSTGNSIIIDGAFSKQQQREQIIKIAKRHKVPYYVLYIYCPENVLRARTLKRFSDGKGVGWKAHLKIKKIYEPLTLPHTVIDTSKNVRLELHNFLKTISF